MNNFTIYHNPRCSTSRQTLDLLIEKGINPEIILYLETPPSEIQLISILKKLKLGPRDLMRKGEAEFKEQNLSDDSKSEKDLIRAMIEFPKLIERPIVIYGERAVIGRPPENVLKIIK